jgi:hypothetical protein
LIEHDFIDKSACESSAHTERFTPNETRFLKLPGNTHLMADKNVSTGAKLAHKKHQISMDAPNAFPYSPAL